MIWLAAVACLYLPSDSTLTCAKDSFLSIVVPLAAVNPCGG